MRWLHYLFSQRPTRSLRMCPQHTRLHVLWLEVLLNLVGPQSTRGSHLCYLHVEIHSNPPEKRQARSKAVDIESGFKTWSEREKENNIPKRCWPNSSLRLTTLNAGSSAPEGPFLEGPERFSHLENRNKVSNLMITLLLYSAILKYEQRFLSGKPF